MQFVSKNVLIIGAHYDDAELGAGGTAAKLLAAGVEVYKLTLTDNYTDFKQRNILVRSETSVSESAAACGALGGVIEIDFPPWNAASLSTQRKPCRPSKGSYTIATLALFLSTIRRT